MRSHIFRTEAEKCRRQAADFAGRPEASFLLRIACSFDELASVQSRPQAGAQKRPNGFERADELGSRAPHPSSSEGYREI